MSGPTKQWFGSAMLSKMTFRSRCNVRQLPQAVGRDIIAIDFS